MKIENIKIAEELIKQLKKIELNIEYIETIIERNSKDSYYLQNIRFSFYEIENETGFIDIKPEWIFIKDETIQDIHKQILESLKDTKIKLEKNIEEL